MQKIIVFSQQELEEMLSGFVVEMPEDGNSTVVFMSEDTFERTHIRNEGGEYKS